MLSVSSNKPAGRFFIKTNYDYISVITIAFLSKMRVFRKAGFYSLLDVSISMPFILITLAFFHLSCVNPFAPKLDDGSLTSELITEQRNPDEVLTNFRYAYTFKDSLLYSNVLDSAFVFQYFDPEQGPSGLFISWTRETDLRTTGRLLRSFDVINLEWLNTIYTITEGEDETQARSFRLDLASSDFSFSVSGFAIFTFHRNPRDGKWRLLRWVDQSDL